LVGEKKISGVLSELSGDLSGVVIGAGLNLRQDKAELPIENATSLKLEGAQALELDDVLAIYLENLRGLYEPWVASGGNATASGLRNQVINACVTLDRAGSNWVRAILPGDAQLEGAAIGIDETGRLLLLPDDQKEVVAVAAGDIVHLRHN
jgi:BirA family biotin operon repressor/biotin-[acetyl-CoA-carboxylase] ligase